MISRPFQPLAAAKWLAVLLPMAVAIGSASAFFLWSLDALTRVRFAHSWLLYLLPLGGLLVGWVYHRFGKSAAAGNNLLIDEIHQPGLGVPKRMAPLVLFGTLATHLFGGSAGREGTALQMGGSIAAAFARWLKLDTTSVRLLLMAGVAAGFGSVFGTPIAGAVFALEVLVIGRMQYDALIPCFIASLVADWTCSAWGIVHTHYHVSVTTPGAHPDLLLFGKAALAAIAFGLAGALFAWSSHRLGGLFNRHIPRPEFRPFVGGLLVIGLFFLAGTPDYLGLGVLGNRPDAITLPAMFTTMEIPASAWIWKLVFTVVTLAAGFKGGEVTPLFFIWSRPRKRARRCIWRTSRPLRRDGARRHLRRRHQHPARLHPARHGTLRRRQRHLPRHRLLHRLPLLRTHRYLRLPTPRRPQIPRPRTRQVTC